MNYAERERINEAAAGRATTLDTNHSQYACESHYGQKQDVQREAQRIISEEKRAGRWQR